MIPTKNVLICGLGGLGSIFASNIQKQKTANLKVLVDKTRYQKYLNTKTYFNGESFIFDVILPEEQNYKADIVIIATKYDGLEFAIEGIKNFLKEDTIIISLLNGISSEELIAKKYGWKNIVLSFYIGHSCVRTGRNIQQDGNYKIVLGSKNNTESDKKIEILAKFFEESNINYRISDNFTEEYWQKFMINVGLNQLCAITGLTLKEIRKNSKLVNQLKYLMKEVEDIAEKKDLYHHKQIYTAAENFLLKEMEDAHPSMLQDIEQKRKTEVEIYAGTVIKLGQKYHVKTPANTSIYNKILEIENSY